MPTRQQLIDALGRADAAGDVTAAREIAAMIQGDGAASAAPAAATSPPSVAPARPAPDTYLSRSVEGLARGLREAPAAARRALEGASAEFVQGLTFGWADEGVAKGISSITGEPEENIRRDVEGWGKKAGDLALPARILGSALTGGIVGKAVPATTTIIGGVPTAAAGAVLDAVGNAAPGKKLEAAMDPVPPIVGALFGLGVPFGAKYGAQAFHTAVDKLRQSAGLPANPYLGKGGAGAQVALSSADDLAQRAGAAPLSGNRQLLQQPAAEGAAGVVRAAGGEPYADMVGAANKMLAEGVEEVGGAANAVTAAAPAVGKEVTQAAGMLYQKLGIAPLTDALEPADIPKITIDVPALPKMFKQSRDIQALLAQQSRHPAFQGVPANNLTRLHDLRARLSAAEDAASTPTEAGIYGAWKRRLTDILEEGAPGYKETVGGYAKASGLDRAFEAGKKFDAGRAMDRDEFAAMPPEERAQFLAGAARRIQDTLDPPAGDPLPAARAKTLVAKFKDRLRPAMGTSAEFDQFMERITPAAEKISTSKAAGAGTTGIMPKADPTLLQVLRNSISGSIPGIATRGTIAGAAHVEGMITGKAQQEIAKRLVEILTEKDPAKIQAAVRMLKKDYSGVPWRKFMLMQAPNVQRALEGEQ